MPHDSGDGFDSGDMGGVVGFEGTPPDWVTKDEVFWPIFGLLVGLAVCAIIVVVLQFVF